MLGVPYGVIATQSQFGQGRDCFAAARLAMTVTTNKKTAGSACGSVNFNRHLGRTVQSPGAIRQGRAEMGPRVALQIRMALGDR